MLWTCLCPALPTRELWSRCVVRDFGAPVLQKHYAAVQALALTEDQADWDEKDDLLVPDLEGMAKYAVRQWCHAVVMRRLGCGPAHHPRAWALWPRCRTLWHRSATRSVVAVPLHQLRPAPNAGAQQPRRRHLRGGAVLQQVTTGTNPSDRPRRLAALAQGLPPVGMMTCQRWPRLARCVWWCLLHSDACGCEACDDGAGCASQAPRSRACCTCHVRWPYSSRS